MGRLLSIDYGRRRCGIAVTDPLRIVASGLTTVDTSKLIEYIRNYVATEQVDAIIVGYPTTMRGQESDSMRYIRPGIGQLRKALPQMEIIFFDERFTSAIAHRAMLDGGMKKSARRDKAIVDEISATIILNDYLESRQYNQ
ncbi:MAG: Holliday junction resolvase RuvX [Bacteroidales bacterium]|nr:Holliday junction resolvase RuvX [Bacteroidales bacterium]MBD5234945.1 Holliday junction resolvase RuvX [Barnesiella sp.]MBD5248434.1 Holliday junction resolvase RuvX [Barnesiella sp.]